MTTAELSGSRIALPADRGNVFELVSDVDVQEYAEKLWLRKGGIWVAADIDPADLEGYELNPLVEDISNIGEIRLAAVRTSYDGMAERKHRLYTIERDGFHHALEVTDPTSQIAEYGVLSFPGFTECIEGPIRQGMHTHLSHQFQTARIASIGSNGIGATGSHYGWSERSLHGLDGMGSARLSFAKALLGSLPLFIQETSMGSVVGHRMLRQNLFGEPVDGKVNTAGQLLLSPAVVDPNNIFRDMALRFIPGLVLDLSKEVAFKTPPRETLALINSARRYGLGKADLIALGNQLIGLLHGTREEDYEEVIAEVPTVVVAGEKDSLAQWRMHERVQSKHPDNLHLVPVKHRGHGLGAKPGRACDKLARSGRFLVEKALNGESLDTTAQL